MRDTGWVNRILQGDGRAGERLVKENYARVFAMLKSLTNRREVAEDLTQQTFSRAWQALSTYRGEARLSTWISRIAYREYTHWLRDRRECTSLDLAESIPDPRAEVGLRTVIFEHALGELTDELRETFLLHYEQEFAAREIAEMMEIPAGTVKSRLFTARNRLRELLSEPGTDSSASTETTRNGTDAEPVRANLPIQAPAKVLIVLEEKPL